LKDINCQQGLVSHAYTALTLNSKSASVRSRTYLEPSFINDDMSQLHDGRCGNSVRKDLDNGKKDQRGIQNVLRDAYARLISGGPEYA